MAYLAAAKRSDTEFAALKQKDECLSALESELVVADAQLDTAEARCGLVCRQLARELARPVVEVAAEACLVTSHIDVDPDAAAESAPADVPRASRAPRNAGSRPDRVVAK